MSVHLRGAPIWGAPPFFFVHPPKKTRRLFFQRLIAVRFVCFDIDHVVPLASAKTAEDMFALCYYTNLQPLWAKDNLRKGAKMPDANQDQKPA